MDADSGRGIGTCGANLASYFGVVFRSGAAPEPKTFFSGSTLASSNQKAACLGRYFWAECALYKPYLKGCRLLWLVSDILVRPFRAWDTMVDLPQGVALGSGWGAPLGLDLAPTARFNHSPGQRPGTKDLKKARALKGRTKTLSTIRKGFYRAG